MTFTRSKAIEKPYVLTAVQSFLVWVFTLTICLIVVGLPVGFPLAIVGSLSVAALEMVSPISGVLLVAGTILSANLLIVLLGAAFLTLKGIHPHEVTWLGWLHGDAEPIYSSTFAACPLTCEVDQPEQ
ncbi:hypothetical protein [Leptolyngbya sp. FACHB-261]|uniref:hypothetical protein n=1 Tax=Leptolyngbya sp. FACHB-261 TaxID=2692806 RepID=UPI00168804D5|nr:hypothetical protein [Leptolyngbya sp. FACHB-261]MBD2100917.1 hypothetical protein [Leptolyngbya sp. FACHB-261]